MPDVLWEGDDGVATLVLNRPDVYNAFHAAFIAELRQEFEKNAKRSDVDAIVFTGAGKAFCAGGDIAAMRDALDHDPKRLFEDLTGHLHPLILGIRKTSKPVVAAINGAVAGGGFGLALACDLRIASDHATFKPAYSRLGIVPDGGISYLLPRLVGHGHANRIILRDETVTASDALRLGLVDQVVKPGELRAAAQREARRMADQPPESFRLTKELLNLSMLPHMEDQLDRERRRNVHSAKGAWLREGIEAFFEKREPVFRKPRREP